MIGCDDDVDVIELLLAAVLVVLAADDDDVDAEMKTTNQSKHEQRERMFHSIVISYNVKSKFNCV